MYLGYGGATTLTLGSNVTVHGRGSIVQSSASTLVNQGTISADVSGQTLSVAVNSFTNTGTVGAERGRVHCTHYHHINGGAPPRIGSFANTGSFGLFRHEDESLSPYFIEHVTIYPGQYRLRRSFWSFTWDKGLGEAERGAGAGRGGAGTWAPRGRGSRSPRATPVS